MSAFDFPVLDGVAPSWADIAVRVSGVSGGSLIEIGDISALKTGSTVEIGYQKEGGRVIKRTRGDKKDEASMTLYASGYQKLLRGLRALMPLRGNQRLVSLVHMNVNVQYTPPGSVDILEYRLKGCRILARTIDGQEGTDATQVELPLNPIEIADVIDGEEYVLI